MGSGRETKQKVEEEKCFMHLDNFDCSVLHLNPVEYSIMHGILYLVIM